MLRAELKEALSSAMKSKDTRAVSTIRLILAALKDRDIAARDKGVMEGISDHECLDLLQTMVKQRRESAALYEKGGRPELANQEREEIVVIRRFQPAQMDAAQTAEAVNTAIAELGASHLKDMGRAMSLLRQRHGGRMDFATASALMKKKLA